MALAKDGRLLIRGATLLTMVPGEKPRPGDLRIAAGRIAEIGSLAPLPDEEQLDARGLTLLPGFVQAHVHLCQTLFRGSAEGLELLPWLRERIWPFEHAHDAASLRASARLSLVELASSGVTSFLSMESVRGTASVFEELRDSGLRGILGNSLIDLSGAGYPEGFGSTREEALREALALASRFDRPEERVHFALSPRFLLSCSPELLAEVAELSREKELRIHTHAAEHPDECKEVEQSFGKSYIAALDDFGLLGARTTLAHCVHLSDADIETLASSGTGVAHCPSTNLKLGSGIAPLSKLVASGIPVGLGSDGAPANNRLDLLSELRLAGLLAQWKSGPGSVEAETLVALATREGARAIGLASECGTLEVGKSADLALFDLEDPRCNPGGDPYTQLVYGARNDQLRHVFAHGVALVEDRQLRMPWSLADLREESRTALQELRKRVSS